MSIEVRGAIEGEMDDIFGLLPKVMNAHREYFLALYRNHPNSLPEHSRVVWVDGRLVSHLRIYDQSVCVGGATARVGAIADVMTLPEYRGKGYMRQCLEDAVDYMRKCGYDFSTIISGVKVYDHCGWERLSVNHYLWNIQKFYLDLPSDYCTRRFELDDTEDVKVVYDQYCLNRPVTQVRSLDYWRRHFNWIKESLEGFFVVTFKERIIGYVRTSKQKDTLHVTEACFLPEHVEANWSLLDVTLRYAEKNGMREFSLYLPDDHPWIGFLLPHGLNTKITQSLLVRLINLKSLLRKLQTKWGSNVRKYALSDLALHIVCGEQHSFLSINDGMIKVTEEMIEPCYKKISLNQQELFTVLLNYSRPSNLNWGERFNLSSQEVEVLDKLLCGPKPIYWKTDVV